MEYEGKLYGKVGDEYFPLQENSQDFEELKSRISKLYKRHKLLQSQIKILSVQKIINKYDSAIDIDNLEKDRMYQNMMSEIKQFIDVQEEELPIGKKVTMCISVLS
ncbi:MAG TPA: hypothetical protein VFM82_03630 [Flavobacteriaceae bacterium]|nr:hypothetical protein [Flavobacteriaceae bacterium]